MAKNRPLSRVNKKLQIEDIIQEFVKKKETGEIAPDRKMRILEIGCGMGIPMHELAHKYKGHVEIHGVTKKESDGNSEMAQKELGIEVEEEHRPTYHYVNLNKEPLQLDGKFDLIYSQFATMFIKDKVRLLEDVQKALNEEGVARIDFWMKDKGKCTPYMTIDHKSLGVEDYVKSHPSLEKKMAGKLPYLEVRKKGKGTELELDRVEENEEGIKHSIYKVKEQNKNLAR